jgi:hypothetical protein
VFCLVLLLHAAIPVGTFDTHDEAMLHLKAYEYFIDCAIVETACVRFSRPSSLLPYYPPAVLRFVVVVGSMSKLTTTMVTIFFLSDCGMQI